ncbi:thiamine phosphate synthase [Paroceanicella profunda]|uniref:Thiamine phosphate synthase n=1 Tax=Paroceanicella profunda TaxID=2579971 RepID=A0A5B8FW13_9RHOB|nr:thiamine phosphate synthase [Paroceanicella profunda]QDL90689.1 thiamine phosphate synthase [Paroceanicella profunda]
MSDAEDTPAPPQIYLVTPPRIELGSFAPRLAEVLDRVEIACLRISLAETDEDEIRRAADTLRELAHARDVAVTIETHFRLVEPLGLDGVHLMDAARSVRDVRKELGPDRIIGVWCGTSRHAGMTAAEIGADYVAFGPFSEPGALGTGKVADPDLIRWWSEMIETPSVAEGGITPELVAELGFSADFYALGAEIWGHPDGPVAAIRALNLLAA